MSNRWKAFFIAIPIAILMQCAIWLFSVLIFPGKVNYDLLSLLGTVSGLVAFFSVRKYLDRTSRP